MRDNILSAYQRGDCNNVATSAALLVQQYGFPGVPFVSNVTSEVAECELLSNARAENATGNYTTAVEVYSDYVQQYENTPLSGQAQTERIEAIFALARQRHEAKQYAEALSTYDLIDLSDPSIGERARASIGEIYIDWGETERAVGNYGTTVRLWKELIDQYPNAPKSSEVPALITGVYKQWGDQLRISSAFEQAVPVYIALIEWANDSGDTISKDFARLQLAETYLAWSNLLHDQGLFEDAYEKSTLVTEADPNPELIRSPTARAIEARPNLLRDWGIELANRGSFREALEKLGDAREYLLSSNQEDLVKLDDLIARTNLDYSAQLTEQGSFVLALLVIDSAAEQAVTEETKTRVTQTRAATLDAFSFSGGRDANSAMQSLVSALCGSTTPPSGSTVPAFALDGERTLFRYQFADGAERTFLSGDLQARTPAELHYIGCEEAEQRVIETCSYGGRTSIRRFRQYRAVTLFAVSTGKIIGRKTFVGSDPEDCAPQITVDQYGRPTRGDKIIGPPPNMEDVEVWLQSHLP